jgi:hypothetical protein
MRLYARFSVEWNGLSLPTEMRPHIGTPPPASLAGKPRLEIGQPDVIRPPVAADRYVMAAPVIRAIDQEPANAGGAHLGEGDFLAGEGGHARLKRALHGVGKPLRIGPAALTATADRGCG